MSQRCFEIFLLVGFIAFLFLGFSLDRTTCAREDPHQIAIILLDSLRHSFDRLVCSWFYLWAWPMLMPTPCWPPSLSRLVHYRCPFSCQLDFLPVQIQEQCQVISSASGYSRVYKNTQSSKQGHQPSGTDDELFGCVCIIFINMAVSGSLSSSRAFGLVISWVMNCGSEKKPKPPPDGSAASLRAVARSVCSCWLFGSICRPFS